METAYKTILLLLVISIFPFCYYLVPKATLNLANHPAKNEIEYIIPKNSPTGKLRKELAYQVKNKNNFKFEKFFRGNNKILELEAVDIASDGTWDYFIASIYNSNGTIIAHYKNQYGLNFNHFSKGEINNFSFHDNNNDGIFDQLLFFEGNNMEVFNINSKGIFPLSDEEMLSIKNTSSKNLTK